MIAYLQELDKFLFLFVNQDLANPFFDFIFPWWRHRFFWIPLYVFVVYFLPKRYGKLGWLMIVTLLFTFAISDVLSSQVIKSLVHRIRPCNEPMLVGLIRVLIPCGSGFSFTSSHATNHFAFVTCLSFMFPQYRSKMFTIGCLWAFSISFAQVYVGVHYPFDVFVGALLGILIGILMARLFKMVANKCHL